MKSIAEIAEEYVDNIDSSQLPLELNSELEVNLQDFLTKNNYEINEDDFEELINEVLNLAEQVYDDVKWDAKEEFKQQLTDVLYDANGVLDNQDKLAVLIEVAAENLIN